MRNLTLFFMFSFIISTITYSQPCLPEGITFGSQEEIDNFQSNYPNCTEIEGDVEIDGNDIVNLSGLNVVTSIEGHLRIWLNGMLTNLSGLDNLTSIGGYLRIKENPSLTSLTGLEGLSSIGGSLHIGYWEFDAGNPVLSSIEGLSNLTSIGGILEIANNPSLTSLNGLDNLDASSITELYIFNNTSLPTCNIQSVCDYLTSPNGSINIYNNASGCNYPIEVMNDCGITFFCLPYGNYYFVNQIDIDNFQTNYPDCFQLEGNVRITGENNINNLNGLSVINSIGGNLQIYNNDILTTLTGLEGLTSIGGTLLIGDYVMGYNWSLTNLTGLENLSSIGNSLIITRNIALESLSGLEGLVSVGDWFWLGYSPSLTSISALSNLNSIGGDFLIGGDYPYNNTLSSLSGLENLTSVQGYLWIEGMNAITSLNGLDNIDAESIENLYIRNNDLLSYCAIESICDYLTSPNGSVDIYDNATGCNSQTEVEEACETIGVENIIHHTEFSIYPNPATNNLYINNKNGLKIETVNIYNQLGQIVFHRNEIGENIDISKLEQGIYIIELISYKLIIKQKLIIEE